MTKGLYELLEGLIQARYARKERLTLLESLNTHLDIPRYQTRLLLEFQLISAMYPKITRRSGSLVSFAEVLPDLHPTDFYSSS